MPFSSGNKPIEKLPSIQVFPFSVLMKFIFLILYSKPTFSYLIFIIKNFLTGFFLVNNVTCTYRYFLFYFQSIFLYIRPLYWIDCRSHHNLHTKISGTDLLYCCRSIVHCSWYKVPSPASDHMNLTQQEKNKKSKSHKPLLQSQTGYFEVESTCSS